MQGLGTWGGFRPRAGNLGLAFHHGLGTWVGFRAEACHRGGVSALKLGTCGGFRHGFENFGTAFHQGLGTWAGFHPKAGYLVWVAGCEASGGRLSGVCRPMPQALVYLYPLPARSHQRC